MSDPTAALPQAYLDSYPRRGVFLRPQHVFNDPTCLLQSHVLLSGPSAYHDLLQPLMAVPTLTTTAAVNLQTPRALAQSSASSHDVAVSSPQVPNMWILRLILPGQTASLASQAALAQARSFMRLLGELASCHVGPLPSSGPISQLTCVLPLPPNHQRYLPIPTQCHPLHSFRGCAAVPIDDLPLPQPS